MNKETVTLYTHTHTHIHRMEYYSAIKKEKMLPFEKTLMDLEDILLCEISVTERQMLYAIAYMWNLKDKTN